ncbi:hypothetical protein DFJ73DRAFT_767648 [Zopfochytrium polystomum]|nr:hypothetical protein DFJ73DRAFT_767648 [Zopfochytrium polystomum]
MFPNLKAEFAGRGWTTGARHETAFPQRQSGSIGAAVSAQAEANRAPYAQHHVQTECGASARFGTSRATAFATSPATAVRVEYYSMGCDRVDPPSFDGIYHKATCARNGGATELSGSWAAAVWPQRGGGDRFGELCSGHPIKGTAADVTSPKLPYFESPSVRSTAPPPFASSVTYPPPAVPRNVAKLLAPSADPVAADLTPAHPPPNKLSTPYPTSSHRLPTTDPCPAPAADTADSTDAENNPTPPPPTRSEVLRERNRQSCRRRRQRRRDERQFLEAERARLTRENAELRRSVQVVEMEKERALQREVAFLRRLHAEQQY